MKIWKMVLLRTASGQPRCVIDLGALMDNDEDFLAPGETKQEPFACDLMTVLAAPLRRVTKSLKHIKAPVSKEKEN
jgi:hypothetical protein